MAIIPREVTAPIPMNEKGEISPQELDVNFFNLLDESLRRNQQREMESVMGGLSDRGFLRSGDTFTQVAENVLGPAEERRAQALLPIASSAAMAGREERLGEQQFQRTRQLQKEQFDRQLEAMRLQAELQKELLQLQNNLAGGFSWGEFGGQLAGSLAGSMFGGIGGGIGAGIGRGIAHKMSSPSEA